MKNLALAAAGFALFAIGVVAGGLFWPPHDPGDDPIFEGVSFHQMQAADAAHRRQHPEAYDPASINRAAPERPTPAKP